MSPSSPALYQAKSIAEVVDDYFGNTRGASPHIGAIEFIGTPSPTKTPVIPTPTYTNTPLPVIETITTTALPPIATATQTSSPLPPPNLDLAH